VEFAEAGVYKKEIPECKKQALESGAYYTQYRVCVRYP